MTHLNEKLVEFARQAVSFQINSLHFYQHAAETTEHPLGRAMFLKLMEQKKLHIAEVEAIFIGMLGEHEWQRIYAEESAHTHPSNCVAELEASVNAHGHQAVADDAQALRLALELKRRVLRFLGNLKDHTEDPEVKSAVSRIEEEERFRYDFLQGQLDSVLNVGVWLDAPEFRVDGRF